MCGRSKGGGRRISSRVKLRDMANFSRCLVIRISSNSSLAHHHHHQHHLKSSLLMLSSSVFSRLIPLGSHPTLNSASHGSGTRKSSSSPVLAFRFLSGYLCSSRRVGNIQDQPLTFPREARVDLNNTSVETALDTIPPPLVLAVSRLSPRCHRLMVLQSSRRIIIPFRSAILC